jgi:hypothetical protein
MPEGKPGRSWGKAVDDFLLLVRASMQTRTAGAPSVLSTNVVELSSLRVERTYFAICGSLT